METKVYRNKGKEHICFIENGILHSRSCSSCGEIKSSDNFSKSSKRFLGHYPVCKDCCKVQDVANYQKNKEKHNKHSRTYYKNNKDKIIEVVTAYTKLNRKKINDYCYARDRDKRQRALTKQFLSEITKIHKQCRELTQETGIKYSVDHIIPLHGENVSGLHVPWNLQFLTEHENCVKSNKWDGTLDNESWRSDCE